MSLGELAIFTSNEMSDLIFPVSLCVFVKVSLSCEHVDQVQKNYIFNICLSVLCPFLLVTELRQGGFVSGGITSLVWFGMSWIHSAFKRHHEINSECVMRMPTEQITWANYLTAKGKIKITYLLQTIWQNRAACRGEISCKYCTFIFMYFTLKQ